MKAIIKTKPGPGNVELVDVPVPGIAETEVLIKVRAMGICGSDILIIDGDMDANVPIILGHEFSGEIVEKGSKVTHFSIGDRVASELSIQSCRWCVDCRRGDFHLCANRRAPGIHMNGVFTEYIALPEFSLHKIPDNISYEEGAVMEPAAVAAHGVLERALIQPEDFVVIIGPGTIGLLALQMVMHYGAKKVVVAGKENDMHLRLLTAQELGADRIINVDRENIEDIVFEMTDGRGADLVVDCAGTQSAIYEGIQVLKKHGRLCTMGMPGEIEIGIPWKKAIFRDMDLIFSYSSSASSWNIVRSMLERGAINVKPLITHRESFSNYQIVLDDATKGNVIKAILFHES